MPTDRERHRLVRDALRRRLGVILGIALLLGFVGFGLDSLRSTTYDATAEVVIYPVAGAPFAEQSHRSNEGDLATEAELVRSDPVADRARDILAKDRADVPTTRSLVKSVTATVPTNSDIIHIDFSSPDRALARDGAAAFAGAYLDYRSALAEQARKAGLAQVAASQRSAQADLAAARAQLASDVPGSAEFARDTVNVDLATKTLADLAQSEIALHHQSVRSGSVLSAPALPRRPAGHAPLLIAAAGVILGLAAGMVVAVARERNSGTIRRIEHLPAEPPLLAVLPAPTTRGSLVDLLTPDAQRTRAGRRGDEEDEAFRAFRLALEAATGRSGQAGVASPGGRTPVVGLTGVSGRVDPVRVAYRLAGEIAASGRAVTVVEAAGGTHLVTTDRPGLADTLLGGIDPVVAREHVAPSVTVLGPGSNLSRAAEGFAGGRMRDVLGRLRAGTDSVVVVAPPLTDPDGQALATTLDGVVLVVTLGRSTHAEIDDTIAQAVRVHCPVLGMVALLPSRTGAFATHHHGASPLQGQRAGVDPGADPDSLTPSSAGRRP